MGFLLSECRRRELRLFLRAGHQCVCCAGTVRYVTYVCSPFEPLFPAAGPNKKLPPLVPGEPWAPRSPVLSPTPSPPLQLRTCTLSTVNRVKIVARERGPPLLAWWPRGGTGARSGQEGRGPARPLQDELHVLWVRATVPWPLRTSRSRNLRTGRNSMAPVALPPASPGDRESKTQRRVEKARARTCAAQTTTPMGDGLRARCTPLRHLRFVHISHFNGRHPNPKVGWVAVLTDPYTYAKYNRPSIPLRCCKISWTLN